MRWKLVKTTIVKSMFIYPCGWARTMSRVVVHLQNISTLSRQLAQRSTPIPIAIIDCHQSCHTMTMMTTPLQDSRHVTSCGTNDDNDNDSHLPNQHQWPSDHLHDSSKFFILFYIFSTSDYFSRLRTTYFLDAGTNHESTENHRGMKHVGCISTLGIFISFLIFSSTNIFNL